MKAILVLAACCAAAAASAHVSIAPAQVPAGSTVRLAFGITHGCQGSATTEVVLRLPHEQLLNARPMPKAGWTIDIERRPLARPYEWHGRRIAESVAEVRWRGGPLANAHYDEFVIAAGLADGSEGALPIDVLQACERGRNDWVGPPGSDAPAPVLRIEPVAPAGHH